MNDEQMQSLLDAWYRDREIPRPKVQNSVAEVMASVLRTRQRGRRWPLPALERPVSTFPSRELAPVHIPATIGPTPARGLTMFSALKFVVASVIVALFGSLVLAGIFTAEPGDDRAPAAVTESPSPTMTEGLLSGMVIEEVEPGVYRVVNDGVRDLTSGENVDIVAGDDRGIWLLREDEFLRLRSDGSHAWPADVTPRDHVFNVAPDGTMWLFPLTVVGDVEAGHTYPDAHRGEGQRSSDGDAWTVRSCPGGECRGVTLARDGTLWANWPEGDEDHWRVGHLGPTSWQPLDGYARSAWGSEGVTTTYTSYDRLFLTDAGDLYGAECWVGGCYLHRYEDGDWLGEDHYGIGYFNYGDLLDVGPDGTVWLEGGIGGGLLSRFADGEWVDWTSADLPDIRFGLGLDYQFEVAPDGSLWSSQWRSADGSDPVLAGWWERTAAAEDGRLLCDGLARFDGDTLDRFLPGQCISMDIAADGSVWVLASGDLYVITQEAIATGL